MNGAAFWDLLAELFAYEPERVDRAVEELKRRGAAPELGRFAQALRRLPAGEREELYTRTFDLDAPAIPYVGHHLFEVPEWRGRFLVELKERMARAGVEPGRELADHLAPMLRYYGRADRDERRVLWEEALRTALERMAGGLEGSANPYRHLLAYVRSALESDQEEGRA